eukprot:scaffold11929_cov107-Isochrysis_galbana.AAC.3
MEQTPADVRAAPSASEPNDTVMDIHASPKRPREAAQGNMVSQSATSKASILPERYGVKGWAIWATRLLRCVESAKTATSERRRPRCERRGRPPGRT